MTFGMAQPLFTIKQARKNSLTMNMNKILLCYHALPHALPHELPHFIRFSKVNYTRYRVTPL